jgi:ribonuclease P protein subunit RPR2
VKVQSHTPRKFVTYRASKIHSKQLISWYKTISKDDRLGYIRNNTMAKTKPTSVPNKVLHSRINYLYQAASYLSTQQQHSNSLQSQLKPNSQQYDNSVSYASASNQLVSDLKAVSLKAQIRMSPAMKQAICKSCNTILVEGSTCSTEIKNKSKGRRKPWADVLVRKCNICGTSKGYPAAIQQKRRPHRPAKMLEMKDEPEVTTET